MNCALHAIAPIRGLALIPKGDAIVFGFSLCTTCAPRVADALIEGASVRDLLRSARSGDWL